MSCKSRILLLSGTAGIRGERLGGQYIDVLQPIPQRGLKFDEPSKVRYAPTGPWQADEPTIIRDRPGAGEWVENPLAMPSECCTLI